MATLLYSQAILEQYKEVSDDINSITGKKRRFPKKTMKQLMQESFFHGASWLGTNFIA